MTHILRIKGKLVELTTKQLFRLYTEIQKVLGDNLEPPTEVAPITNPQMIEVIWPHPTQPPFDETDPGPFFQTICGCGNCVQNGLN